MFDSRRFWIAIILCLAGAVLYADENHFKNVLVGDRAATMGGAYLGISDDSSGSYYNPAGLVYGMGDSISGSGNAFHQTKTYYKKTIGLRDWERESETILPNFFGITKRFENIMIAFSYIVPDSFIEHQDQSFKKILSGIDEYYISLHVEEEANLAGPSIAYFVNEKWSIGLSVFYGWKTTRKIQNEFFLLSDNTSENNFSSTKINENNLLYKVGIQSNHFEPFTIGFVLSETVPLSKKTKRYNPYILNNGTSNNILSETNSLPKKSRQFSFGIAYYPSDNWLYSVDMDYILSEGKYLKNILNYSFGSEYFLDAENAFRLGYFTNYDNRIEPGEYTVAPHEKIDLNGFTLGYTSFTKTSSFTIGYVNTSGNGSAQVYSNNSELRKISKVSTTFLFAASYNY